MTRSEHVAWAKKRAHEYLARNEIRDAIASMVSDMNKRDDCRMGPELGFLGMRIVLDHDTEAAKRFIDGFN